MQSLRKPVTDKSQLKAALLRQLEADLAVLTDAALLARDEAIDEESRAESKWDTRGQEAAYLAEGQAKMAQELREAIELWRNLKLPDSEPTATIGIGTVFILNQRPRPLRGFVGPKAGGVEFTHEDESYTVVTPVSPLGRAVMGKRAGEFVNLMVRRKPQPHQITAVF
jgi:transcription elongation GreA/GreB family factor